MRFHYGINCLHCAAIGATLLGVSFPGAASQTLELVDARIRPDKPFSAYSPLWSEQVAPDSETNRLGATIKVWFRNVSDTDAPLTNVSLEGIGLSRAVSFSQKKVARLYPASIRFSDLSGDEMDRLISAGEPLWWKADPAVLHPGAYGELTVRLRRLPAKQVRLRCENVDSMPRLAPADEPEFKAIAFAYGLDVIYAYVSAVPSCGKPSRVLLDGMDLSGRIHVGVDPLLDTIPVVVRLKQPLKRGSYHVLSAEWERGSRAVAGFRAFSDDLVYGMWGYSRKGASEEERVRLYLEDLRAHNVNAVMFSYGAEVGHYLSGETGLLNAKTLAIRAMRTGPGKDLNPLCYFLKDEPDAHDDAVAALQPALRLGALGQAVVRLSAEMRRQDPATPQLLNVDNTFKPENWYVYGQLPDIMCADPYFQEQQRIVWTRRPASAPKFLKPAYVLGAAEICRWSCAPNPLHIILNAVRHDASDGPFRYATPEEKTVELFYALGAGATGFSYWWYTPYGEFMGCGADDPKAKLLWTRIGELGSQVRAAGPWIVRSCPAAVPVRAPSGVWARSLLSGLDSMILLLVNDRMASDRLGTVVTPVENVQVNLDCPAWLEARKTFEVTPHGTQPVQIERENGTARLNVGRLDLARMFLITSEESPPPGKR